MKGQMTYFQSVEEIERFVFLMDRSEFQADLQCGKFVVDAKSLIGVLCIGAQKPVRLVIHGEINEKLRQELSAFCCR